MCGVAPRVLAAIEADSGSPNVETLEKLLRPFGYRMGVVMNATEGWEERADNVGKAGERRGAWPGPESALTRALRRSRRKDE
jgi:hypothetical protein